MKEDLSTALWRAKALLFTIADMTLFLLRAKAQMKADEKEGTK